MNKSLLLTTAAITLGGFVVAGPAMAAANTTSQPMNNSQTETASQPKNGQQLVNDAEQTIQQFKQNQHFETLAKKAKGIFFVPELVKGAFLVGGSGGQGVLLKHEGNGSWSHPAFMNMGSVSFGAQIGGSSSQIVMLLMTQKALNDFVQANNLSLNGSAGLTVVTASAQGNVTTNNGDVIVMAKRAGAFAGISVSGADLTQNTSEDHSYYNKQVSAQQILDGDVSSHGAESLINALPS